VVTAATTRRLLALLAAIGALTAIALSPATAGAKTFGLNCPGSTQQPFKPWLDPASYILAPGGDFEAASAWTLTGGAKIVSGNEPYKVHSASDGNSLSIPAGGSATSPPICVGLTYPTLRLFASGGNLLSLLKVDVIYKTALGTTTQPVMLLPVMPNWAPTLPMLFLANATGITSLDGLTSSVQFRFTVLGNAGWKIDDVYVDPWRAS
jgi:hypothetical protein